MCAASILAVRGTRVLDRTEDGEKDGIGDADADPVWPLDRERWEAGVSEAIRGGFPVAGRGGSLHCAVQGSGLVRSVI